MVEKVRFGTVSDNTATADQAKVALRANPGITVVFASYASRVTIEAARTS